ncbi:hypothetical protein FRAHR75_40058 [Frankia sp. Hr75.2]|nr:hypothetical protein FRAHR75_40058 [Frankia sp. Hr75.2]
MRTPGRGNGPVVVPPWPSRREMAQRATRKTLWLRDAHSSGRYPWPGVELPFLADRPR